MSNDTRVRLIAEIDATSKGLVDALKQASTAVNDTTGNWKSQFSSLKDATNTIGASVRNLSQLVKEVGNVDMNITGMEEIGKAISTVRGSFDGVKADVDAFVSSLSVMKAEAQQFGMPMEEFGRFSEAVKASGVSMSEALQMVKAMQEQIQALANGVPEAQATFDKLGLTIEQLSSNTVSANFEAISQAINSTIPSSERATQNMNLFKASIDKTMAVAQEYNKTISKQQGSYATDKDVQNATQLQSALTKLTEQLSGLAEGTNNAAVAQRTFIDRSSEILDVTNNEENLLKSVISTLDRYNESLAQSSSKAIDASDAYNYLRSQVNDITRALSHGGEGDRDYLTFELIPRMTEAVKTFATKVQTEYEHVQSIMNQRISAGAPIDTKELETVINHLGGVLSSIEVLESSFKRFGIAVPDSFKSISNSLLDLISNASEKAETISHLNFNLDVSKAKGSINAFNETLKEARSTMEKGIKPTIDMTELDKARDSINEFNKALNHDSSMVKSNGILDIQDAGETLGELKGKLSDVIEKAKELKIPTEGIDEFKQKSKEAVEVLDQLFLSGKNGTVSDETISNVIGKLGEIRSVAQSLSEKHKVEIDTTTLDTAISKARELKEGLANSTIGANSTDFVQDVLGKASEAMMGLRDKVGEIQANVSTMFSNVSLEELTNVNSQLGSASDLIKTLAEGEALANSNLSDFSTTASGLATQIDGILQPLERLKEEYDLEIDLSDLQKASDTIKKIESKTVQIKTDTSIVEQLNNGLKEAEEGARRINEEVSKGVPRWQPVVNAVNRFKTYLKQCEHPIRDTLKRGWDAIGDAISVATNKLTHFKYKAEETKKPTQTIGSVFKQATGQILGMGSAVAVLVKAWHNLVALAKAYAKSVIEARNAALWGNGLDSMQQMTQIRTKQESRYESAQGMMKEMAQAHDEWKETNNQVAYNKYKTLENRLDKLYHITFKHDSGGRITNIDQQITDRMKDFRAKTLEAIEGGIKQAQQVMSSANQFLKDSSYWDEVLDHIGGIHSMEDAAKATQQAQQTIADLTEARTKIRAIDPTREFMRERNGAREQKEYEKAKKERENEQKAEQERAKKLQEGTKKLEDWENSLTDNERQKEYRSIMAKYNEAIEAGVKEEDARRVATEAITALLKHEEAEEKKKNQELLDAVQKKIDAYKQTYQRYLDAEKRLVDAKKQYADAQRDLAREAKAERIQQRREAIARKLRTFGFSLPENFDMQESNRQRMARRRNRKNDNSIGEKLVQWEEGRKVHWTKAERERLGEYQALQSKDKQLEAIQKQMDAAQQTENAAERLGSAADAVRDAALKFNDMRDELVKARNEMNDAMDKKQRTHTNEADPSDIFDELKKGNYAGVKEPKQRYNYDYSDLDEKLREKERKMRRRQENDIEFDTGVETVVRKAKRRDRRNRGLEINGTPDSVEKGRGLRIGGVSTQLKKGEGLRIPRSDSRGLVTRQQLKGLKAPGLAGLQTKQINYSDILSMIHRDLVEMARKTFRVR